MNCWFNLSSNQLGWSGIGGELQTQEGSARGRIVEGGEPSFIDAKQCLVRGCHNERNRKCIAWKGGAIPISYARACWNVQRGLWRMCSEMSLWRPTPTRRQQFRRMQLQDLQQRRTAPNETPFCELVTIGPCENMSAEGTIKGFGPWRSASRVAKNNRNGMR